MAVFHWNPRFVTGSTEVDNRHHHLMDVINRFGDLAMLQGSTSIAELESVFAELPACVRHHFVQEEALTTAGEPLARCYERRLSFIRSGASIAKVCGGFRQTSRQLFAAGFATSTGEILWA